MKSGAGPKERPQRLKPHGCWIANGTAEAVPLSEAEFRQARREARQARREFRQARWSFVKRGGVSAPAEALAKKAEFLGRIEGRLFGGRRTTRAVPKVAMESAS
jgi:hypothetical protein